MIKIVRGDLLQAKENIIGHQVNCQGKMNSGIAKSVREAYPEVYSRYMRLAESYIREGHQGDLLGKTQFVKLKKEQKYIVNIFGQLNYGYDGRKYTSTEALFSAFKEIRVEAEEHGLSVALPYLLGCYRGGADWKEVEDLLLTAFDGYEVTLYKLHRG